MRVRGGGCGWCAVATTVWGASTRCAATAGVCGCEVAAGEEYAGVRWRWGTRCAVVAVVRGAGAGELGGMRVRGLVDSGCADAVGYAGVRWRWCGGCTVATAGEECAGARWRWCAATAVRGVHSGNSGGGVCGCEVAVGYEVRSGGGGMRVRSNSGGGVCGCEVAVGCAATAGEECAGVRWRWGTRCAVAAGAGVQWVCGGWGAVGVRGLGGMRVRGLVDSVCGCEVAVGCEAAAGEECAGAVVAVVRSNSGAGA